jgi:hypothetical protein
MFNRLITAHNYNNISINFDAYLKACEVLSFIFHTQWYIRVMAEIRDGSDVSRFGMISHNVRNYANTAGRNDCSYCHLFGHIEQN